jgi:hypothetical protein
MISYALCFLPALITDDGADHAELSSANRWLVATAVCHLTSCATIRSPAEYEVASCSYEDQGIARPLVMASYRLHGLQHDNAFHRAAISAGLKNR